MTSAWLLIQKSYHGELMGIPVVRWAVFLALTLVVFLFLRVLVTAARSRLKARSVLTEQRLNDYLLQLLERTWTLSLLRSSGDTIPNSEKLSMVSPELDATSARGNPVSVHHSCPKR